MEATRPIPLVRRRAPKHPPYALPPGTVVADRYVVEGHIGLGGTSVVYRAHHRILDYPVALKVGLNLEEEAFDRFARESRALSRIDDPHVVRVTDLGELPNGFPFCVMQLLFGESLEHNLTTHGQLPIGRAVALTRQLCEGLRAVHRTGVIHRDVKPANLVLTRGDDDETVLVLVDFGIAMPLLAPRITLPGLVLGTPHYMAPEQAVLGRIDTRVDVYGAGAVLYEMLAGRPPHEAATIAELIGLARNGRPEPVELFRPDCPAVVAQIAMRALARDPNERFATVRLMSEALAAAESELRTTDDEMSIRLCA